MAHGVFYTFHSRLPVSIKATLSATVAMNRQCVLSNSSLPFAVFQNPGESAIWRMYPASTGTKVSATEILAA